MKSFNGIAEFIAVVDSKSFVAAGHYLGISPSGVSKAIRRLEDRLGTRLLIRTTRSLSLTAHGAAFYQRCNRLISELEEAEESVSRSSSVPKGRLTVELPRRIGKLYVMRELPAFAQRYPDLVVHAVFREQYEDLDDESIDVAVRLAGIMKPRYVERSIGSTRYVTCASSGYLKHNGVPRKPIDLLHHNCLAVLSPHTGHPREWHFSRRGTPFSIAISANLAMSNSEGLVQAAIEGAGVVQLLDLIVLQAVASGTLRVVLRDWVAERRDLNVIYPTSKRSLPKVRLFGDFVSEIFAKAINQAREVFAFAR